MARRKPPSPKAPKEALDWFAAQIPFTRPERDALDEESRKQAFFVSNVTQLRVVADVHVAISKAIAKGETLATFKERAAAKLVAEWGGEIPGRLETIFRTNVQSAYNAGRLEIFEDPVVKQLRPYRAWSVILDQRTTEFICKPLKRVVVLADSVFAKTHVPPMHFNCRTGVMSLSLEDVGEEGGATQPQHLPDAPPQEGFGGDPRRQPELDLSGTPMALRRILAHKLRARPTGAKRLDEQ